MGEAVERAQTGSVRGAAARREAWSAGIEQKSVEQLQALLLEAMVAVGEQRETGNDQDHA